MSGADRQGQREAAIRSVGTGRMTRWQVVACLEELAERASESGVEGRVILVGGAALTLAYDRPQATVDIDVAASPSGPLLEIAATMASRYGLQANWLNQDAVGFMPHEDFETTVVIERPGITIEAAPAGVLLAMKLRACRASKDSYDVAWLLRQCDIRSVEEAVSQLDRFFPEEEMPEHGRTLVEALLGDVQLPTAPPTKLPAVEPREPSATCRQWILKMDRFCSLPFGHDGEHA